MWDFRKSMLWVLIAFLGWTSPIFTTVCGGQEAEAGRSVQPAWRLGVLFWHESPNDIAALEGIREAFDESGHEYRLLIQQAGSDPKKAHQILQQFQAESVDLIFAMGTQAALLAAKHVSTTPVVFTAVTSPVESGIVSSWEGSGRNLAGNSNWIASETLLHIFRLAVPKLARLGMLRSELTGVVSRAELGAMRDYLKKPEAPAVEVVEEIVDKVESIGPAVQRLVKSSIQAIWIPIDFFVYENMAEVLDALDSCTIPLVSSSLKGIRTGAVAGVVVDYRMLGKRATVIALDILVGKRPPGKIPIGTVNGYQVIVNIKTARRCNCEPPLQLLVLADSILQDDALGEKKNDKKDGK